MTACRGIASCNGRTISSCSGGRSLYKPLYPAPTCTLGVRGDGTVVKAGSTGLVQGIGWPGARLMSSTHPL